MRNLSYENEYDLHSNGLVSKTHFHMKGFALGLVLKQRQKRTRKWPIVRIHGRKDVDVDHVIHWVWGGGGGAFSHTSVRMTICEYAMHLKSV